MHATELEPSGPGATSVPAAGAARGGRRVHRWIVIGVVLAVAGTALTGWMGAAQAATTDQLQALRGRLGERVEVTRATSAQLDAAIEVARGVREDAAGLGRAERAELGEAIRSAEAIAGQRLTTQEPGTVAQAEMLVRQAGLLEETLALAAEDLRTAVDQVRVHQVRAGRAGAGAGEAGFRSAGYRPGVGATAVAQP
ncbi:hypothetical protein [Myceligenerans crystallogenes]|uniref:Uncharacterized protein n=1 Tax=Myceligenerans crystallogenes TaxID=316335 RepID=A0ABN2N4F4_9MICO